MDLLGLNKKNKSIWCGKIKRSVLFLSYGLVNGRQEKKMQENIFKVQSKRVRKEIKDGRRKIRYFKRK
jgi:hypothetical protein